MPLSVSPKDAADKEMKNVLVLLCGFLNINCYELNTMETMAIISVILTLIGHSVVGS